MAGKPKVELTPVQIIDALGKHDTRRQTPFMARKGLSAHIGGWIVEVTVGEMHNTFKGEFVAFY